LSINKHVWSIYIRRIVIGYLESWFWIVVVRTVMFWSLDAQPFFCSREDNNQPLMTFIKLSIGLKTSFKIRLFYAPTVFEEISKTLYDISDIRDDSRQLSTYRNVNPFLRHFNAILILLKFLNLA
jgi:hypothetical protein